MKLLNNWRARNWAAIVGATLGAAVTGCGAADDSPGTGRNPTSTCEPADRVLVCGHRLNIAHRGGAELAPENTLVAFENADRLGVDALELDVHSTLDGVIVVIHDDEVDRTTDGTGQVSAMTFDELRQLDAGYQFTTDGGTSYPHRGRGVVIPTLEEVLRRVPDQRFIIEIKQTTPPIGDAVARIVEDENAEDRVIIASIYDEVLFEIRDNHPELLTSMAGGEIVTFYFLHDATEVGYEPPAPVLQAPSEFVDAELMARANRIGVGVQAWTVNDAARAEELLALDVGGIITDNPEMVAAVIAGLESSPPR